MTMTVDRPVQSESLPVLGRECWMPGGGFGVLHALSEQGVPMVQRIAGGEAVGCPGAVPLPVVGEMVHILPSGEDGPVLAGCWMGYWPREAPNAQTTMVRVLDGAEILSRVVPVIALDAVTVVTGMASPETKDAVRAAASVSSLVARKRTEHEDFLDRLVADAHEYANRNDLCVHFDDFMEKWGFPRREQEYVVRIEFDPVVVRVTAESQECAEQSIGSDDVIAALGSNGPLPDWSVA